MKLFFILLGVSSSKRYHHGKSIHRSDEKSQHCAPNVGTDNSEGTACPEQVSHVSGSVLPKLRPGHLYWWIISTWFQVVRRNRFISNRRWMGSGRQGTKYLG